jgi:hypothetical protein
MLTIPLDAELERVLREEARREGVDAVQLARQLLAERLTRHGNGQASYPGTLSAAESGLLKRINEGFPEEFWTRFRALKAKHEDASIDEAERQELIRLVYRVEEANARRFEALSELAALRGTSLLDEMQRLGIQPPKDE